MISYVSTAEVPNTRAGDAALSISTSLTVANTSFDGGDTKGYTDVNMIVFTEAVSNFNIHCSRSQVLFRLVLHNNYKTEF